ncbi:universal stress protein [Blastococcus sp. CT_GayMR19]|nr:universal stress protein [Blastococcus sp. CT_GayMR19]
MRGPRVVAAVDGSAGSRAALQFALEDAARRGVPVEAVIAFRPPDYWMDFNGVGAAEEERLIRTLGAQHEEKARAVLEEVTRALSGPVPEVHVRAVMGTPSDVLIRESQGADLLVLGSRGHGGFHNMLLGSTSMQCTMHATCPVTVVQSPEAHRHRLKLHRERRRERGPEARARRRGTVGERSEAGAQN